MYKVEDHEYNDCEFASLGDALAYIANQIKEGLSNSSNISLYREIPFTVDVKVNVD
jgi:hypothetical protein